MPAVAGLPGGEGRLEGDPMTRSTAGFVLRTTAAFLLALGALSCESSGDTVVVNGLDCGLIRADLVGNWTVTYTADSALTQACDNPAFNGTLVTVSGASVVYANPTVFASPSGAAINVIAPGPFGLPNELLAAVEADSCLGLVQTWEDDEGGWVQCFGTADLTTRLMPGVCDSFDIDSNNDGAADVACDLDHSLVAQIGLP
jgi:hypothetical protein